MRARWAPCGGRLHIKGRGFVRCWNPPTSGNTLCEAHARGQMDDQPSTHSQDRVLGVGREPFRATGRPGTEAALRLPDRDLLGQLRAILDGIHTMGLEFEARLRLLERAVRESEVCRARLVKLEQDHEALQQIHAALMHEHESVVAALTDLRSARDEMGQVLAAVRAQAEAFAEERRRTVAELEGVVRRLHNAAM
jgi:hypothetical protein